MVLTYRFNQDNVVNACIEQVLGIETVPGFELQKLQML